MRTIISLIHIYYENIFYYITIFIITKYVKGTNKYTIIIIYVVLLLCLIHFGVIIKLLLVLVSNEGRFCGARKHYLM